ncbi:hypothetical protein FB639_000066 [Coemansia asiatica]|nr:hypothetical protein FB639_000066 [Coemansia asiatica]
MIEPPTLAATQIKPALLVKSASEELQIAKEDDADDLGCIQTLRVPGELVLAVFRREYYPARIIAKISENRYKVEFFDGFKNILSRSSMFTMYDKKFKTCRLGRFQLVGDEPAIRRTSLGTIDLETDFSRDMVIFRDLVKQVEAVRKHLDRLHQCSADELEKMAETEYRIKTFFSGDANSKRLLASQVSSGFLNRAEFDFLGRLLSRWYRDPPSAASAADAQHQISQTRETEQKIEQSGLSTTDPSSPKSVLTEDTDATEILPEAVESNERLCSHNTSKTGTEQESEPASKNTHCALDLDQHEKSSLALRFVYDVLVPHAIRRMTVNREACSLEESEQLMRSKNRENQWVEHILAARGISLETWI